MTPTLHSNWSASRLLASDWSSELSADVGESERSCQAILTRVPHRQARWEDHNSCRLWVLGSPELCKIPRHLHQHQGKGLQGQKNLQVVCRYQRSVWMARWPSGGGGLHLHQLLVCTMSNKQWKWVRPKVGRFFGAWEKKRWLVGRGLGGWWVRSSDRGRDTDSECSSDLASCFLWWVTLGRVSPLSLSNLLIWGCGKDLQKFLFQSDGGDVWSTAGWCKLVNRKPMKQQERN